MADPRQPTAPVDQFGLIKFGNPPHVRPALAPAAPSDPGGVVLTAMGAGWVVHPADAPPTPELAAAIEQLPVEPAYVPIAVSPRLPLADRAVLAAVAERLRHDGVLRLLPRATGIRLAVPFAGQGPDPAAGRLSGLLHRTVVAPDGPVWIAVDQSLLVGPAAGGGPGRWRVFTPDGAASDTGPRHPAPPWQQADPRTAVPGVVDIPAGWWLTSGQIRPDAPDDVTFDLAPARSRCLLVVGGPGGDPVAADRVADHLRRLPGTTRAQCVLVGYDSRHPAGPIAREMAAVLREPVRYGGGLPMISDDGTEQLFTVHDGNLVTAGFVEVAEALPDGGEHRVVAARPPVSGWSAADDHAWSLIAGWKAEVVLSGLWLRPENVPADRGETVRRLPPEPGVLLVIVETGSSGTAELPATVLTHLLARLPADKRTRVRVTGPGAPDQR